MRCFVGGEYKYDVFISYATAGGPLKQPSEAIYHAIGSRLTLLLKPEFLSKDSSVIVREKPIIYFDSDRDRKHNPHPTETLDDALRDKAEASATFLMFWSSWYASSAVCKLERSAWLKNNYRSLDRRPSVISVQKRFIPILLDDRDSDIYKHDINSIKEYFGANYNPIGVKFYHVDERLPFGLGLPNPNEDADFRAGIAEICSALREILEEIRSENLDVQKAWGRRGGSVFHERQTIVSAQTQKLPTDAQKPNAKTADNLDANRVTLNNAPSSYEDARGISLAPEQKAYKDTVDVEEKIDSDEQRGISLE